MTLKRVGGRGRVRLISTGIETAPAVRHAHPLTHGPNSPTLTHIIGIQLAMGPQQLRLRKHIFGLTHRIMVKRLATSPHDALGITDSACKNQSIMVRVQYGPFNTYIPIRSTIIGKSRVARDPITMHTSWRSNSDIACVTREHCDVLSMQMDSDLVIYRTTLVRTFQVALSVIPRGSWGDVARRFTMIRWLPKRHRPSSQLSSRPRLHPRAAACRDWTCSDRLDEEIPFVSNSSDLLVQTDEGLVFPVVDLIKENLPPPTLKCWIPCESGRSQAPRRQQVLEFAEFVDGHFFNQLRTVHVVVGNCDSYDSAAILFCKETTNEISPRNSMLLRTRHFDLKITPGFIRQTKEDMSSGMPRKDEWLPETTHKSPSTIRHKRKKRGKQKYEGSGEEIATNRPGENKDNLGYYKFKR
ncbi:hypothetical protein F511_23190 [Dorcoceras hygrometricum]|uniref:Uncharacterized protein n=1 Tax=Dorcoceras hygrometricum TaxID=472368 RepID=A0A2Z7BG58_9LAMI|nr:hypothetical protein F511_23190 [Dorcoceras hygrometricum]